MSHILKVRCQGRCTKKCSLGFGCMKGLVASSHVPDAVHAEHGSNDGHFLTAAQLTGGKQGSPQAGVQGKLCHLVA